MKMFHFVQNLLLYVIMNKNKLIYILIIDKKNRKIIKTELTIVLESKSGNN